MFLAGGALARGTARVRESQRGSGALPRALRCRGHDGLDAGPRLPPRPTKGERRRGGTDRPRRCAGNLASIRCVPAPDSRVGMIRLGRVASTCPRRTRETLREAGQSRSDRNLRGIDGIIYGFRDFPRRTPGLTFRICEAPSVLPARLRRPNAEGTARTAARQRRSDRAGADRETQQ